jgi:hypothetical protein
MAARKTTRKTTRKKTSAKSAIRRFEEEVLPADLRAYSRRVRRGLSRVEREIEKSQRDARRRWTRLLRDVSHQLGRIEAQGEKRWNQRTTQARRDAVKLLKKLERAIEPPKKRPATRKKVASKPA